MKHNDIYKPILASLLIMLFVGAYFDPTLTQYLPHWPHAAEAIDGHTATNLLGQINGVDAAFPTSSGADNAPSARGMGEPEGMVIDTAKHRLFVGDYDNHRVLVYNLDSSNHLIDSIADNVLGQSNFKSNGATGGNAGLSNVQGLALDQDAELLYVADFGSNRVMVFDVSTVTNNMAAVHVLGQPGFDTADAATTATGMSGPIDMAVDSVGKRLFVVESNNNRVLVFDTSGGLSDGMAASFELGQNDTGGPNGGDADFFNDAETATTATGMRIPRGLAYDHARELLFVAEANNSRVTVFDVAGITNGEPAINELGQDDSVGANAGDSDFFNDGDCGPDNDVVVCSPDGVKFDDTTQLLYVPDASYNRVMVFDTSGGITNGMAASNVLGQSGFGSSSPATTSTGMKDPEYVYVDSNGTLYVADTSNNRVMVFDVSSISDGEPADDLLGQLDEHDDPVYTVGNANGAPNPQGFNGPGCTVVDPVNHRAYVCDTANNRILVFSLGTNNDLDNHTADFVLGQSDVNHKDAGGGDSGMSEPSNVAVDSAGQRLFVSDANNNRVLVFNTTSLSNGQSAENVIGEPDFATVTPATTQSRLNTPQALAYDHDNQRLFVADQGNNRVMVFNVDPSVLIPNTPATDGPNAIHELGHFPSDYTAQAPESNTQHGFDVPDGVTYDGLHKRLFVADAAGIRVMVFNVDPGTITDGEDASNVIGQADYSSTDSGVTANRFTDPEQVEVDMTGERLFVSDTSSNRVMVFNVHPAILVPNDPSTDGPDAIDVYGQSDLVSSDPGVSDHELTSPFGVSFDSVDHVLWVADTGSNRIMMFGRTSASSGGAGTPPPGVSFEPDHIVINDDDQTTDSKNVLVSLFANFTSTFNGTVTVLLSNDPQFSTFMPFSYNLPEYNAQGGQINGWPKTVAWDLCFGLTTAECTLGRRVVYARYYVNIPAPTPALTPTP